MYKKIRKTDDPRVQRSKRMFKDALISLIEEYPDRSKLTVQNIADRAELNRATFYLHYHDVKDLMQQMIDEMLSELRSLLKPKDEQAKESFSGRTRLITFIDYFYKNASFYNIMLENKAFRRKVFSVILDIVMYWEPRRTTRNPHPLPNEIIASSTLGIISWWLEEGTPYSPNYLANLIIQLFEHGNNH
ncbi:TetR family transcriptional regulator C-terminal domain-containing protein [Sporolactobacillus shoreicorticis]|uniref:TetR/AcrR family transcriptional regulator n=1 Tax=Sporolactobacillus shoreicorticis TaxID=1923877 RepID=A0ABW5S0S1_9BACL|nr:TetR-like C-terminal domain-containing protein [Sporolactobacillus shoreicorticis]MCO7124510.1 TetR family transcriptional regulator C-terminal domain-containing protein [Sporolactobacillus shoreicorticis]